MFEPDKITRNGAPSNGSAQKDTPLREASKPLMLQGKMWVIASLPIPSRQPSLPDPHNLAGIPTHPSTGPRHAVVGVMAPHHGRQVGMLHGDRPMPVIPAPVRHPRQRSGIAALGRDLSDHVDPFARLAPDMGEAKEVERQGSRTWCHAQPGGGCPPAA